MFLFHLLRSLLFGNKGNNVEQWFIVLLLVLYNICSITHVHEQLFLHTERIYRNSQKTLYLKRLFTNQNGIHLQRHFLAGDSDKPTESTALQMGNIQVWNKEWKKTWPSQLGEGLKWKTVAGPNCSKIEFELMPPDGEWESLQQKIEVWGQFRGAGWFPPGSLWKVWWKQKVKVEKKKWRTKVFPKKRSILIHWWFYCSRCQTV